MAENDGQRAGGEMRYPRKETKGNETKRNNMNLNETKGNERKRKETKRNNMNLNETKGNENEMKRN